MLCEPHSLSIIKLHLLTKGFKRKCRKQSLRKSRRFWTSTPLARIPNTGHLCNFYENPANLHQQQLRFSSAGNGILFPITLFIRSSRPSLESCSGSLLNHWGLTAVGKWKNLLMIKIYALPLIEFLENDIDFPSSGIKLCELSLSKATEL